MPRKAQLEGARLFAADVQRAALDARLAYLLADDTYERGVTKVFGLPQVNQSLLVKVLLTGAAVTAVGDLVGRCRLLHPTRDDAAMGGMVVNATIAALA